MDWETRTRCKAPGLMGAFQNLTSNPMFYFSIMQTIGDAYQRAKESGASEAQARWAAMGESLLNAGIELGGGVGYFAKRSGRRPRGSSQGMVREAISSLVYDPEKQARHFESTASQGRSIITVSMEEL